LYLSIKMRSFALLLTIFLPLIAAWVPATPVARRSVTLAASSESSSASWKHPLAAATAAIVASPWAAVAVEDNYEYGAVDAPIGIAVAAGLLAILTAAVPVLLSPGEKAFEEMRERDEKTFGTKDSSVLDKRKKK
jgi:hypothetical protein